MPACTAGHMPYMPVIDPDLKLREARGSGFACPVAFIPSAILFYEKSFWANWVISVFKSFPDALNSSCNDLLQLCLGRLGSFTLGITEYVMNVASGKSTFTTHLTNFIFFSS